MKNRNENEYSSFILLNSDFFWKGLKWIRLQKY